MGGEMMKSTILAPIFYINQTISQKNLRACLSGGGGVITLRCGQIFASTGRQQKGVEPKKKDLLIDKCLRLTACCLLHPLTPLMPPQIQKSVTPFCI